MDGNRILITGAGSGLGYATARLLAGRRAQQVFITTTSAASAEAAAKKLVGEFRIQTHGLELDLSSRASIASCAQNLERLLGDGKKLDAVSFNAGTQIVSGFKRNEDGHELTMAVNQLGHVRLLFQLWDRIASAGRVVFVGSGTHTRDDKLSRVFGFRGSSFTSVAEWLDGAGDARRSPAQQGLDRYANSKLANIMTALELTRRVPPSRMTFYALDPGLMPGTGLARNHNWFERFGWRVIRVLIPVIPGSSWPEDSAKIMAELLLGERSATTVEGHYLDFKGRPALISALASDPLAARTMLDQTFEILGLNPHILGNGQPL